MLAHVLVVLVVLQLSSQQEVPGILQKRNQQAGKRLSLSNSNETCDGTRFFSTCGSCEAVSVCVGSTMEWRHCPYVNPDKPFCNNGECSATPSYNENCPPSMYCTGAGYYPDPNTCDIYHYCEAKYTMSSVYKCPQNYVFNPESFFCKRKLQDADCMKIKCNPDEIFSRYGTSKRFFGYCRFSGSGLQTYGMDVFKCPDGTEFTGKTCSFQCPAEGRFPDSVDPRGYYECYYTDGEALTAVYQMCPSGKVYNAKLATCILNLSTTPVPTEAYPNDKPSE